MTSQSIQTQLHDYFATYKQKHVGRNSFGNFHVFQEMLGRIDDLCVYLETESKDDLVVTGYICELLSTYKTEDSNEIEQLTRLAMKLNHFTANLVDAPSRKHYLYDILSKTPYLTQGEKYYFVAKKNRLLKLNSLSKKPSFTAPAEENVSWDNLTSL